jgi:hypothetical protein
LEREIDELVYALYGHTPEEKSEIETCNAPRFVRKTDCISDQMRSNKTAQPIESRILRRIHGIGKGSVFTPTRFLDVGSRKRGLKGVSSEWPLDKT